MHDDITALGYTICELLTFCYEPKHKRTLGKEPREAGVTYEQYVAAALAQCLAERRSSRSGDSGGSRFTGGRGIGGTQKFDRICRQCVQRKTRRRKVGGRSYSGDRWESSEW